MKRLIKPPVAIEQLRKASAITSQLHLMAMNCQIIGKSELDLSYYLEKLMKLTEAKGWAYPVIVGSGKRSTILHARPTKRQMRKDELVLLDMGVRYGDFCSDVTRTWPTGNKFLKEQKTIYQIVLKAQKEVIKKAQPGVSLDDLHELCQQHLQEGLLAKGVIRTKQVNKYFLHKTSHWIGTDVHDQCPYYYQDHSPIVLAPGMCFTVEPGLYFKGTHSRYEGIGVRIEDIVLVTQRGAEVLSHVPKEVDELEELRSLTF